MGIIRSQSIKSTLITYIGFSIGAINLMFIMPRFFTNVQIGLIQAFIAFTAQIVTIGSLGMTVVINKFLPYYKVHLEPNKRDIITFTIIIGTLGMVLTIGLSFLNLDMVIRKFSKNSPLFVNYIYLLPFFAFGYFFYFIFESFNNNYKFTVWSSFVRELFYKLFNLLATLFFAIGILGFTGVMNMYALMYWFGTILLILNLTKFKLFYIPLKISTLTKRLRKNIATYSLSTWGISILSVTFQFIDIFAITGLIGLGKLAIYGISKFIISTIVIPSNSVLNISVPLISAAWRQNDIQKIEEIYKKTALVLVMIGGFLFLLIMASANDILGLLPSKFFGTQDAFIQAKYVILILGLARMLDFTTSVNSHILQNSKKYYWIDLTCNVVSVFFAIPLNYFLIKKYGIIGAPIAYLFLSFFANGFKATFLYFKEKIHPFSGRWKILFLVTLVAIICSFLLNYLFNIPVLNILVQDNISRIIRIIIRSLILSGIFIPIAYWLNISDDISGMIKLFLKKLPFKRNIKRL